MQELELTIEVPCPTKNLRANRKPTVFRRVISRLATERKNPGIIIPIMTFINGDYKIFGALTLNSGGSVSFFPDFYKLERFDHLTLNGDFIQKKGHLTKVETTGKHKKLIHIETSKLAEGNSYHLITFLMIDDDLLMDAPPEIEYAKITYRNEQEKQLFNTWLDISVSRGSCILEFPKANGGYGIQICLFPKNVAVKNLQILRDPIENLLLQYKSLEQDDFMAKKIEIETSDKTDFSICMTTFRIPHQLKSPFCFSIAQDHGNGIQKK